MILGQPATLKPAQGLRIRKEDGQFLAEDGEAVIATSYWLRRLNDGDVAEMAAVTPPAPKDKG